MKKKILWLALSCLMVAALVLGSCAPAVTEEEGVAPTEEEEEEVAITELVPEEEKPQYGGTFTVAYSGLFGVFDPIISAADDFYLPCYDSLVAPDITRGPRGTKEVALTGFVPDEFLIGYVAESWEQPDLTHLAFNIRKGVHFHNKPPVNGREMTAEDVVFSFNYNFDHPKSAMYSPPSKEGYSAMVDPDDKWRVIVTLPEPSVTDMLDVGWSLMVLPHEIVDNIDNWKYMTGTGPFVVVDVVQGSSLTYERHPLYWQFDPFHPENRLPYVDKFRILIIPDLETRLAALRTGKVERMGGISREQALNLQETAPRLKVKAEDPNDATIIEMMNNKEPFSDKRVRWAISMAIDHPGIKEDFFEGAADILTWPLAKGTAGASYTPLEELPESTRKLFEHRPEEARQLLAEAGYPDGFKTEIATTAAYVDEVVVVQANLREVGIEVEIKVMESGAYWGMVMGHGTQQMSGSVWGSEYPYLQFASAFYHKGGVPHVWNFSYIIDDYIVDTWSQIKATLDPAERAQMLKELNVYALDMCYNIQLPAEYTYTFWQPWVKDYYGESVGAAYGGYVGIVKHLWIDQDLKYEMTGRR